MTKKIISLILLIVTMFTFSISYAIEGVSETQFFRSAKQEAKSSEVIELYVDLNSIEYDEFQFSLSSNVGIENIGIDGAKENLQNISAKLENNKFTITANKADLTMSKITLYYKISENVTPNQTINLTAQIAGIIEGEVNKEEASTANIEIKVVGEDIKIKDENNQDDKTQIELEEQIKNDELQNQEEQEVREGIEELKSNIINMEVKEEKTSTVNQTQNLIISSNFSSKDASAVETVTYKGSSNNYLESLSINGYELLPKFLKTTSTYFMEVENVVTEISISAVEEDSKSEVRIYGNEDLKVGQNKVLISVTAENGNVRTYKIYVTRKEA